MKYKFFWLAKETKKGWILGLAIGNKPTKNIPRFRFSSEEYVKRVLNGGIVFVAMNNCCWIADTGRFNQFVKNETFNESEPYPTDKVVIIGRGSIIDMSEHNLIQVVK